MNNFDWTAFKAGKIAVNCRTDNIARNFFRTLINHGTEVWCDARQIVVDDTRWSLYGLETCYGMFYDYGHGGIAICNYEYLSGTNIAMVEWQPKTQPGACYGMSVMQTYNPNVISKAKHDTGKPRLTLVPPQILFDIAEVREYGLKKYGDPENWRNVDYQRYIDAAFRHWVEFVKDPKSVDPESGIAHYKHVECNMAFISELMKGV